MNILDHAERFAPLWHISNQDEISTFAEHLGKCRLNLVDVDGGLLPIKVNCTLAELHESSASCGSRTWKKHSVSPLSVTQLLDASRAKPVKACYVVAAKDNTLCYFLCAPSALKKGYLPHVFIELNTDLTVARVFARTHRVRNNSFRLLKIKFEGDRPVVHVTQNTFEATSVSGVTFAKLGEPDGVSWSTREFAIEKLHKVCLPSTADFNSCEHGFLSYSGSWENGPCINLQDFVTLSGSDPQDTESETTVATWELAYLIVLSVFYLFVMGIMIGLAFYYMKQVH